MDETLARLSAAKVCHYLYTVIVAKMCHLLVGAIKVLRVVSAGSMCDEIYDGQDFQLGLLLPIDSNTLIFLRNLAILINW